MKNTISAKQNIKKDFIWNTIGSTINAFNSLFFMIIVTRINGVKDAGIFTFAFSTATLFYMIGIYAGRIYQVTDKESISDKDYLSQKIIACFIMILVSIIFIVVKEYNLQKSIVILTLCILKMLDAGSEVIYAYFQKRNQLYKVGISLILKNALSLLVFFMINILTKNIVISSTSLIICYLAISLIYDLKMICIKEIIKQRTNWNHVWTIFIKGFFTFCLSFLTMYIVNIPRYAIDAKMTDEFSTIFGILIMPASAMVLFAQFTLQPFVMSLKECLDQNNIKKFTTIVLKITMIILAFGVIAWLGAYLLGIPLLELLYNIPLQAYKKSLLIIVTGSIMCAITNILSNILVSMRVTFMQTIIYIVNVIIAIILSDKLVSVKGIEGACLSYSIAICNCLICFIVLAVYSIVKRRRDVLKSA